MGLLGNEIIRDNDFLIGHTQLWETACVPCALSPRQQGVEKQHILFKKMICLQNIQNQQLQIPTHNLHTCTQSPSFHQGNQTPRPKGHASATAEECFSFTFKSELAVITQHVSTQALCYSKGKSSLQSPTSNSTLTTSTLPVCG